MKDTGATDVKDDTMGAMMSKCFDIIANVNQLWSGVD